MVSAWRALAHCVRQSVALLSEPVFLVNPPKRENPRRIRGNHMSYEFHPIRYTGYRAIKDKPWPSPGFAFEKNTCNSFGMTILPATHLDGRICVLTNPQPRHSRQLGM